MADDSGLGIPGKGPLASAGVGLIGLLLLIAIVFALDAWCSDESYNSLDSLPNSMEQYCQQYPELCATATP